MNQKFTYFDTIKFLSGYIKKHKSNFLRFYFGFVVEMILKIVMPLLFGIMIDTVVYRQNVPLFLNISMVYVFLALFMCLLYFFIYAQHHYLMNMYTYDIRMDVFKHMMNCKAEYLVDTSSGDLNTLLSMDSDECMHFIIRNVIHMSNNIIRLLFITYYLFRVDYRIGLFALVAAPLSVLINTKFGRKIRQYGETTREVYGHYIGWLFEMIEGLREIRILGASDHVNRVFKDYHRDMYGIERKSGILSYFAERSMILVSLLIKLSIYAFAGYLAVHGQITIGILTVILGFYTDYTVCAEMISKGYLDAQTRISHIKRICDFLQSETEAEDTGKRKLEISKGAIEIKDLSFSYEGKISIFSHLNLMIQPGEKVAFVGKSGCGKSTLAYLLIGFYEAQAGEILIDGQSIRECTLSSIRKQIGMVAQDVLIFPGTIRQNIMLGNRNASDEELMKVCQQAGLWDVIQGLPDGLDTVIGQNGNDLSGGQKQRLAIARIYLRNPKIILFDEATSALDPETEAEIHGAWTNVLKGRTAIVITHRESTLLFCDRTIHLSEDMVC